MKSIYILYHLPLLNDSEPYEVGMFSSFKEGMNAGSDFVSRFYNYKDFDFQTERPGVWMWNSATSKVCLLKRLIDYRYWEK